ncbi:thiamine pyrophosphokinase [Polychaeton citri CBS 116435]|uniref:Thiamine pyrophosphokinase n=1 Tax=Polychaeton citri CBS 116435 TaxID=1314669 RepID=A0A9P4QDF2_9PEZI|nr:thiamine pyrophosphokinase [Polychaeton citri CBS 116435]
MPSIEADGSLFELRPTRYLESRVEDSDDDFWGRDTTALIILNSPIEDAEYFRRLYEHSSFVLCADGGANRLYDLMIQEHADFEWIDALPKALPSIIHGDLDSLNHHVRRCYDELGVEINGDSDEYSTDFDKAVRKVKERLPEVQNVLILGSLGGRVDQGVGLLHELFREQKFRNPALRFWFFTESSVSIILQPGTTKIWTPLGQELITRNIGILPLYGPARISTKGCEWDVDDWPTELGGQVSTSNHIVNDHLLITTDRDVLFTVERHQKL